MHDESLSILAAARRAPAAIGLRTDDRTFSFGELARLVRSRLGAADMRDGGTAPFVLEGTNSSDTLVTLYALLERQRPALLLHPRLTERERRAALQAAGRGEAAPHAGAAVIVFSSGTTGEPKAAVLTRAALLASAAASAANLGWNDDDCWLLAMPVARVGGLSIVTRCLAARRTVALAAGFDAGTLPAQIDRHRATLVSLVPAMLSRMLDAHADWMPPPHLRAVLVGGAAAPVRLLERAARRRLPIVVTYGCTETCSQVVATPYALRFEAARCGAGRPLAGAQVQVVDGRIEVRGAMRMAGYAGDVPLDPQAWFDTGDLGRFDADGFLHVTGRAGDTIVSGGEKVHPAEVEQVLEAFPGIGCACVFGVPDETWGEVVCAALVAPGAAIDEQALAAFVAARLAPYKRPRRVGLVAALPQTDAGKPDREALRRLAPSLRQLPAAPATAA